MLEIWVRDHSRTVKMAPFNRSHMAFYQSSIVSTALSRTTFEFLDGENTVTLKSRLGGHPTCEFMYNLYITELYTAGAIFLWPQYISFFIHLYTESREKS